MAGAQHVNAHGNRVKPNLACYLSSVQTQTRLPLAKRAVNQLGAEG